MSETLVFGVLVGYFGALMLIAWLTSRGASTDDFFVAGRSSPWYLVAFGMIGASISGVTFISVPGAVRAGQFAYFQMVLGYVLGYVVIGLVLMPLYYRLNLVSIYTYLESRFGFWSYKTGAFFFLLSRTVGASFRLYLAASVLHLGLFRAWGIPFEWTAVICIFLIWVYTFQGGIKTIVWTDTFQTAFLVGALVLSIYSIGTELQWSIPTLTAKVADSPYSQIFFWNWADDKYFFKQFISGALITIVMTGLDQDLMQKNLTCRSLADAQKNMFWFTVILVAVNFLFLSLGVLLYEYAAAKGIALPRKSDELYPLLAFQHFGLVAGVAFLLGITASTYASADSALASLTTSFCVDFLGINRYEESTRKRLVRATHLGFSVLLAVLIVVFKLVSDAYPESNVISQLFTAAGYTYGPLLGLYAFGLLLPYRLRDAWVPLVCVLAPIAAYWLNDYAVQAWGFKFGFLILGVNGLITFLGLCVLAKPSPK